MRRCSRLPGRHALGPAPHTRVRLSEVAEVFRPRVGKEAGDEITARAGDLLLTTTATGFAARRLDEGEAITGLHAIVVRALDGGSATPSWLLLWTQTEEFAGLVDRHAKGTTIRSLSAKDLLEFELDMPATEVQAQSEQLLERLDRLGAVKEALGEVLDQLRSAELRLAYAEVTK